MARLGSAYQQNLAGRNLRKNVKSFVHHNQPCQFFLHFTTSVSKKRPSAAKFYVSGLAISACPRYNLCKIQQFYGDFHEISCAYCRWREREQSVSAHLSGTAELAAQFASGFGAARDARLVGLLHDIGKYTKGFQTRLHGGPRVDHSTAGAKEAFAARNLPAALGARRTPRRAFRMQETDDDAAEETRRCSDASSGRFLPTRSGAARSRCPVAVHRTF